jgi:hypothetical protein
MQNTNLKVWSTAHPSMNRVVDIFSRHLRLQAYLRADPSFTLANMSYLTAQGYPPEDALDHIPIFSPLLYSLQGFANTDNTVHWDSLLRWVQFSFDPRLLLVRRINSEAPPKGRAENCELNVRVPRPTCSSNKLPSLMMDSVILICYLTNSPW